MPRGSAVAAWGRTALLAGITALLLVPVLVTVGRALTGPDGGVSVGGLAAQAVDPQTVGWLIVSAAVTGATVLVTTVVAAPAGWVLSRGRGRAVHALAILVFAVQSLPVVLLLVPLFLLYAAIGLVGSLVGVVVLYVAVALSVAVWTMGSALDAVPVEVEEAAWLDGCSVTGAFLRVVLPNAVPGLLATATAVFLFAWNDWWIALAFLADPDRFPVGLALATVTRSPAVAVAALVPPLVVLAVFHRVLRFGGVGGAVTGA